MNKQINKSRKDSKDEAGIKNGIEVEASGNMSQCALISVISTFQIKAAKLS